MTWPGTTGSEPAAPVVTGTVMAGSVMTWPASTGSEPTASAARRDGHARATWLALALGAGYAGWASGTAPFSVLAYAAVAAPGALLLAALVLQRRWPTSGPWQRLCAARPVRDGGAAGWIFVIALLLGVELASYFHGGPRAAYPTLSSAIDALARWRAARAAMWAAWLAVGSYLVRR